ncbi:MULTISPECIES: PspC domain-containing protein [unclassified Methanosarcina]|uniref:PspC domain-containing protein n=1 Tax=unclassified Methanosarcina TaxID=2644672 RepID=UPI00064F469D|nr:MULTISPECIES: PspC domain-containing protein [unclassified Methanosarcina]
MQENPDFEEKKDPKESDFKAPGELETGYTEKSWEKPEKTMEETEKEASIEPLPQERIEPKESDFKAPGELETGYTEKSWEKPEKTMEETKEEARTESGERTSEEKEETKEEKRTVYKMEKRLTKSKSDRMLFGVCSGLGKYFGIDPTFVRLVFVLLALIDGIGIVIYIILAIIMPSEESVQMVPETRKSS